MDSFVPQRSRMCIYRTAEAEITPTIADNGYPNHIGWEPTDIYDGEFFLNTATDELWIRSGDKIIKLMGEGVVPSQVQPGDIVTNYGDPATTGVSSLYSRADHAHGYITPSKVGGDNGNVLSLIEYEDNGNRIVPAQTTTICLAQANAMPQTILKLLG